MKKLKVVVIGTGYVGLVAGAGFAKFGHDVVCVDNDVKKIVGLMEGKLPIYEPGLGPLVDEVTKDHRLQFSYRMESIAQADVVIIAVGTPDVDGAADVSAVRHVAHQIAESIQKPLVVVTKSTVPVGTAAMITKILHHSSPLGSACTVGSNPEFLKEGTAVDDFLRPDRVVIGADDEETAQTLRELYGPIPDDKVLQMSCASAELSKYAANAMLATRISFMNEIAALAERTSANVTDVKRAMATDPRIGPAFLNAGAAYGGSCFPKDVRELIATARRVGVGLHIVSATENVNQAQKHLIANRLIDFFEEHNAKHPRVAILGLAFKPGTDDVRDAPSLVVIRRLLAAGFSVHAHDPVANENARNALGLAGERVSFHSSPRAAVADADALVLMTEWPEYAMILDEELYDSMRHGYIFDGRNVVDYHKAMKLGFVYYGIGGHGQQEKSF